MLIDAEPGASGAEVLASDDVGPRAQRGGLGGGAVEIFVAIGGDHDRIVIGHLEIDCECAHMFVRLSKCGDAADSQIGRHHRLHEAA